MHPPLFPQHSQPPPHSSTSLVLLTWATDSHSPVEMTTGSCLQLRFLQPWALLGAHAISVLPVSLPRKFPQTSTTPYFLPLKPQRYVHLAHYRNREQVPQFLQHPRPFLCFPGKVSLRPFSLPTCWRDHDLFFSHYHAISLSSLSFFFSSLAWYLPSFSFLYALKENCSRVCCQPLCDKQIQTKQNKTDYKHEGLITFKNNAHGEASQVSSTSVYSGS